MDLESQDRTRTSPVARSASVFFRSQALLSGAGLAALTIVSFSPFWTSSYALRDDYAALVTAPGVGLGDMAQIAIIEGRILYAWLLDALYGAAETIQGLWWIRVVTAVGILALAMTVERTLRMYGESRLDATLVAAAVAVLPPMVIWASWAILFAPAWGAVLGCAAGALAVQRRRATAQTARHQAVRYLASAGLLIAALSSYQPAAQFFWVSVTAWMLLCAPSSATERRKALAGTVLLYGASCICYVVLWSASAAVQPADSLARADETKSLISFTEIPEKLIWFAQEPIKQSANVFFFGEQGEVAAIVAAASVLGVGLIFYRRGIPVAEGLVVAGALIVLSHLPNLVVSLSWAAYRTRGAIAATVFLVALFAARELLWRAGASRWVWRTILMLLVVSHAVYLRQHIAPRIIEPQQEELALLRSRVETLAAGPARKVLFRMPGPVDNQAQLYRYDEIGYPSSATEWVPPTMVMLVWKEVTGSAFDGEVVPVLPTEPLPESMPPDTAIIDMPAEYARTVARAR